MWSDFWGEPFFLWFNHANVNAVQLQSGRTSGQSLGSSILGFRDAKRLLERTIFRVGENLMALSQRNVSFLWEFIWCLSMYDQVKFSCLWCRCRTFWQCSLWQNILTSIVTELSVVEVAGRENLKNFVGGSGGGPAIWRAQGSQVGGEGRGRRGRRIRMLRLQRVFCHTPSRSFFPEFGVICVIFLLHGTSCESGLGATVKISCLSSRDGFDLFG